MQYISFQLQPCLLHSSELKHQQWGWMLHGVWWEDGFCGHSNPSPAAPGSSSNVYPWVSLWACTNVALCSISCSACDTRLFRKQEFLVYAALRMNEYVLISNLPHIASPALQPWGVKIDMAFPKELAILGLCLCPLPPVLHASPDVPQCFSFTSARKQQWFGELCGAACFLPCQLIAAPKAHSANLLIITFLHQLFSWVKSLLLGLQHPSKTVAALVYCAE